MVGDTVMVSDDGASSPRFFSSTSSESLGTTIQQRIATFRVSENETAGSSFLGKAFRHAELPSEVTKLSWNHGDHQQVSDINQSLNDGTAMQY